MFVYIDDYGFYQLLTFLDAFSGLLIHHELLGQVTSEAVAAALKKAAPSEPTATAASILHPEMPPVFL